MPPQSKLLISYAKGMSRERSRSPRGSQPPEECEFEGSETETSAEVAPAKARAYAGVLTFPCPRQYCVAFEERKKTKVLKPSDITQQGFIDLFRAECKRRGSLHQLVKCACADEPHPRFTLPGDGEPVRERHKFSFSSSPSFTPL